MGVSPPSMSSAPVSAPQIPLLQAIRSFELFRDLTEEQLQWYVEHASDEWFAAGEQLVREGDEADTMNLIIEGQLRYQSSALDLPVMIGRAGIPTGRLPFSRLKSYIGTAYAITPLRLSRLHYSYFPEMLQRIPEWGPRLVAIMSDRIRESTRSIEQREKVKALGKLAAGLAHELNNPASAAQRSAQDLRNWVCLLRDSNQALADSGFSAQEFQCLLELERALIHAQEQAPLLEALERSDREELLASWLSRYEIARAWEIAPVFVDAGVSQERLLDVIHCFSVVAREPALARLAAALAINQLTTGIISSTQQITDLVRAVKEYSFVDQAPEQEIDVVQGIENTLSILSHRLRQQITVLRDYDEMLPRLHANGVEMNQVWTQLIENALDAMPDGGTLRIRAVCEAGMVLIEIADSGKGIPPEIQGKIFDPFFTTKDVGGGRGLGLDLVFRTMQKHRGDIRFTSKPGETVFQVRLPVQNLDAF
jgi:signal transduction histidine kinase